MSTRHSAHALSRNPLGLCAIGVLGALVVACMLAPWIAPYDPEALRIDMSYAPPGDDYLLGGDDAGRDIFSRLLFGGRTTLGGALVAVVVAVVFGVATGLIAGYFGRAVDTALNALAEILLTLPAIVVLLALFRPFGSSMPLTMTVLGILLSPGMSRLVRGLVREARQQPYIDAARLAGLGPGRIIGRHILRSIRGPVIVQASILAGVAVTLQAGFEFLGLGDPSQPSWGGMLADAVSTLSTAPWFSFWPGALITATVASLLLLGTAVRDSLQLRAAVSPGIPSAERTGPGRDEPRPAQMPRAAAPPPLATVASSAAAGRPLLRVQALSITLASGATIVNDATLTVHRGESLGLVGESGAGKSQTAHAILGLLPRGCRVGGGRIEFDGAELTELAPGPRRRLLGARIGYVPQDPLRNLDPAFTIGAQLVEVVQAASGLRRREARRRSLALLTQVGLDEPTRIMRAYPHEVSGGQAQRALIAAAIAHGPELLIADEITSALDPDSQSGMLALLQQLRCELGMAVLFIAHDLGIVAQMCERVAVMQHGRIVETGTTETVFAAPQHPHTRALLDSRSGSRAPAGRHPEPMAAATEPASAVMTATATVAVVAPVRPETSWPASGGSAPSGSATGGCAPGGSTPSGSAPSGPEANCPGPLLRLADVAVDHPAAGWSGPSRRVLHGVNLEIAAGETVGLVGASGSGKTTLGRAVLGLSPVASGTIEMDGQRVTGMSPARRALLGLDAQAIFQDPRSSLNPAMTIADILTEPLITQGARRREAHARVADLLERVHLPRDAAERRAAEFSGGQLQRIATARALALSPRLIVCDEPVSALDLSTRARVLELLTEIQVDTGVAYLFISHDLDAIHHVSHRVAVLRDGTIAECRSPKSLQS